MLCCYGSKFVVFLCKRHEDWGSFFFVVCRILHLQRHNVQRVFCCCREQDMCREHFLLLREHDMCMIYISHVHDMCREFLVVVVGITICA